MKIDSCCSRYSWTVSSKGQEEMPPYAQPFLFSKIRRRGYQTPRRRTIVVQWAERLICALKIPGLKSRLSDQSSWLRFSWFSQYVLAGILLQIGPLPIPSSSTQGSGFCPHFIKLFRSLVHFCCICRWLFQPWKWRQKVPLESWCPPTRLPNITD